MQIADPADAAGLERIAPFDADARIRVCRAIDRSDGTPVILKSPIGEPPDARVAERVGLEHALLCELDCEAVPRPRALIERELSFMLVLEHILGERLDAVIGAAPGSIERFFEIALRLVAAFECVHCCNIIHRDLRPRNVVPTRRRGHCRSSTSARPRACRASCCCPCGSASSRAGRPTCRPSRPGA